MYATTWVAFEYVMLNTEADLKGCILCNSLHLKSAEYANPQIQKADQQLPRDVGREVLESVEILCGEMEMVWNQIVVKIAQHCEYARDL